MNIDIVMTVTTIIVSIVVTFVTSIIQKQLNKNHVKFTDLQLEFMSMVIDKTNIGDDIDSLMHILKQTYCKMLDTKKKENDDNGVRIVLRKYVPQKEYLIVVYCLPYSTKISNILYKDSPQFKNNMANLYVNSNEQIKKVFKYNNKTNYSQYGTYMSYTLRKQGNIIGVLNISSQQRVNERYSYENIKKLIEPIEDILISYIENKDDNFWLSDNG